MASTMADTTVHLEPYTPYHGHGSTPLASRMSHAFDTVHTQDSKSREFREYYFYKGNGLSPKARIESSDATKYRLVADIHRSKPSSIQLQTDQGQSTVCIGTLTFPPTHNDFSIQLPQTSTPTVNVKARVGYPHPSAYELDLPATALSGPRKVVWKRRGDTSRTNGYDLRDAFTDELLASWRLMSGAKHQMSMRLHMQPSSHSEEILLLLSYLGVVSRLKLRGKDHEGLPGGMLRYNGFWFMAILGTAAVGA